MLRLRGKGLPSPDSYGTGDELINVMVYVPENLTSSEKKAIESLKDSPNVKPSDKVLDAMQRHITRAQQEELIATLRREVPGIHLRTTLMVGFPGEGEQEFQELMQFTRDMRFERMGAFAYSQEEGTFAAKHYDDIVPEQVKQERLKQLMDLQESISQEIQNEKVGKTLRVIVDGEDDDYYVGRTQWDSPEVDPEVLISKRVPLEIGQFCQVKINEALPFELLGDVAQ